MARVYFNGVHVIYGNRVRGLTNKRDIHTKSKMKDSMRTDQLHVLPNQAE